MTTAVIKRSAMLHTGREGGKTRDDDNTEITAARDTDTEIPATSKAEERGQEQARERRERTLKFTTVPYQPMLIGCALERWDAAVLCCKHAPFRKWI